MMMMMMMMKITETSLQYYNSQHLMDSDAIVSVAYFKHKILVRSRASCDLAKFDLT